MNLKSEPTKKILNPKVKMIDTVEEVSKEVLSAHQVSSIPVNPLEIADREKISLCPVEATKGAFWGRIEYHREAGRFLLFYPDGPNIAATRRNFSIGHELGHYFLPNHRSALEKGIIHNSEPGFICNRELEREADAFAASLLMPAKAIQRIVRDRGFMTLEQLINFSEQCGTSRESAAIRYAKFTEESCVILISEKGRVLYSVPSDEARYAKCTISTGTMVPKGSATAKALSGDGVSQGEVSLNSWFPTTYLEGNVWEEAIPLGYSDLVLSLVSWGST